MSLEKGYYLKKEYERLCSEIKKERQKLEDKLPSFESLMKDESLWEIRENILKTHDYSLSNNLVERLQQVRKELREWLQWAIQGSNKKNSGFCITQYLEIPACTLVEVLCENRVIQTERCKNPDSNSN